VKLSGNRLDYPEGKDSIFVLARNVNDFMPRHLFHLTMEALTEAGKQSPGSKVALLGWAFINDSDDARNTPSELYRELLLEAGINVEVHDPYVKSFGDVYISQDLPHVLHGADIVAVLTGHNEYANLHAAELKEAMGKEKPIVVDGRNVVDPDEYIKNGFVYRGIGRGDKNRQFVKHEKARA
jgi:UDP-N-acetyl-D-mannosaminuronic acid dehydrogenase